MAEFYIDQFVKKQAPTATGAPEFSVLCRLISDAFLREWEADTEDARRILDMQKRAIIGYRQEVQYFLNRIHVLISEYQAEDTVFPCWYDNLAEAVYHENWGMAGVAEWFGAVCRESSSAKVIGDRIYFLESGEMVLKPQTISEERREQLVRAFLLLTPEERMDRDFHEIYLLDGTRITVFRGAMTKPGQDVIIFRRYIIPSYSFEEQAEKGTIPAAAIPLFQTMVRLGFNVAFCGAVRSAKTTFLSTWQRYEDQRLEGVMVETDPEIPLHRLMPEAPLIQLLADQDRMKHIARNLLRSDGDYFILAEARDGIALDTAVRMARKGTRRMKITFHTRDPLLFAQDVAVEIVRSLGGDPPETALRVAGSFDYVFHFVQLDRKNQKRLKSIHEIGLDTDAEGRQKIRVQELCRYDYRSDSWRWFYRMGADKRSGGEEEDVQALQMFDRLLRELAGAELPEKTEKGEAACTF